MTDEDLFVHIVIGFGKEYKEITAGVQTRKTAISFDQLYEKLIDYETMSKCNEDFSSTNNTITTYATIKQLNKNSYNLRHNNG